MPDFSSRPFAGLFDPTETPAPLPSSPMAGALPPPPSLAGTPAGVVAGGGGGAGAFDPKQLLQLLPLIFARNQGAKAAFLEGWQRAQQMDERRKLEENQQRLYERQLDESAESRRVASEGQAQDRSLRLKNAAEARLTNLLKELEGITEPEAFKSRVASADQQLAQEFGEAYMPGSIVERARMTPPAVKDFAPMAPAITRILRQVKDDEAAIGLLKQSQYKDAAYQLGFLLDDETGQTTLFRDPEPASGGAGSDLERQVADLVAAEEEATGKPVTRARRAEIRRQAKDQLADAARAPVPQRSAALADVRALQGDWRKAIASAREMQRQFTLMQRGIERAKAGDLNAGSQAVLVTFQKILDPTSVVRESEYARSSEGVSLLSRMEGEATRMASGGAGVPIADLEQFVNTAQAFMDGLSDNMAAERERIEKTASAFGIDPDLIFSASDLKSSPGGEIDAPAAAGGPKVGDIVTVKGRKVRVTKVNPDGTISGTVVR